MTITVDDIINLQKKYGIWKCDHKWKLFEKHRESVRKGTPYGYDESYEWHIINQCSKCGFITSN